MRAGRWGISRACGYVPSRASRRRGLHATAPWHGACLASRPGPRMRSLTTLLLAAAVASVAWAGGSSPLLTLTRAEVVAGPAGVAVDARGSFNFEDVVEGVFPAGLVVHQGTRFARFDQAGAVAVGDAAFLADGFAAGEAPALAALGDPAPAPAALVALRTDRVTVVLPPGFAPGTATVTLYAVYEGAGWASNPITVTLP